MRVRDIFASLPMLYGAPTAAALGAVLGLAFQIGDQTAPAPLPLDAPRPAEAPVPIAWPGATVPDYVIGTDFLRRDARGSEPIELAAAPVVEVYEPIAYRHDPYAPPYAPPPPRPAVDETRWASSQGDILDIRLPEDAPPPPRVEPPLQVAAAPL